MNIDIQTTPGLFFAAFGVFFDGVLENDMGVPPINQIKSVAFDLIYRGRAFQATPATPGSIVNP